MREPDAADAGARDVLLAGIRQDGGPPTSSHVIASRYVTGVPSTARSSSRSCASAGSITTFGSEHGEQRAAGHDVRRVVLDRRSRRQAHAARSRRRTAGDRRADGAVGERRRSRRQERHLTCRSRRTIEHQLVGRERERRRGRGSPRPAVTLPPVRFSTASTRATLGGSAARPLPRCGRSPQRMARPIAEADQLCHIDLLDLHRASRPASREPRPHEHRSPCSSSIVRSPGASRAAPR